MALGGLDRLIRLRQGRLVLMYHGVVPDDEALADGDWLQVRASEFDAQLAYLRAHFDVVPLPRLIDDPAPGRRTKLAITFDDGYANNHAVALPLLERHRLPATIFVCTGFVGTAHLFWWDRLHLARRAGVDSAPADIAGFKTLPSVRLDAAVDAFLHERGWRAPAIPPDAYRCVTEDEFVALAAHPLITLGAHTHRHEILTQTEPARVAATIAESCGYLDCHSIRCDLFAPPNGDYDDSHIRQLQNAGIRACVSTVDAHWHRQSPYRIPRIGVGRGTSLHRFAYRLSGLRAWIKARR